MANLKFTGFSAVAPVSTTIMVGVAGGVNTQWTVADLQLSDLGGAVDLATQVSGVLPLAEGGTGSSAQPTILDNVTDAASASANQILSSDGANASWVDPTDLPQVPMQSILYAKWAGFTKPFFNFTNGSTVIVPFDWIYINQNSGGLAALWTYNNVSATESTFTCNSAGVYKFSVNMHFFDQYGDLDIVCGAYVAGTSSVFLGLIDQKDVTGDTDSNWYGSNVFPLGTGDTIDIRVTFSGGSGQSPFPSTTNALEPNLMIERVGD